MATELFESETALVKSSDRPLADLIAECEEITNFLNSVATILARMGTHHYASIFGSVKNRESILEAALLARTSHGLQEQLVKLAAKLFEGIGAIDAVEKAKARDNAMIARKVISRANGIYHVHGYVRMAFTVTSDKTVVSSLEELAEKFPQYTVPDPVTPDQRALWLKSSADTTSGSAIAPSPRSPRYQKIYSALSSVAYSITRFFQDRGAWLAVAIAVAIALFMVITLATHGLGGAGLALLLKLFSVKAAASAIGAKIAAGANAILQWFKSLSMVLQGLVQVATAVVMFVTLVLPAYLFNRLDRFVKIRTAVKRQDTAVYYQGPEIDGYKYGAIKHFTYERLHLALPFSTASTKLAFATHKKLQDASNYGEYTRHWDEGRQQKALQKSRENFKKCCRCFHFSNKKVLQQTSKSAKIENSIS